MSAAEITTLAIQLPETATPIFSALIFSSPACVITRCLYDFQSEGLKAQALYNTFLSVTEGVWELNHRGPAKTCDDILIPANIVEIYDSSYYLTRDNGIRIASPIASYLIERADTIPLSYLDIFSRRKSAISRAAILQLLALQNDGTGVRETDIENGTGIDLKTLTDHMQHFLELGLIDYRYHDMESFGLYPYELNPEASIDEIKIVKNRPKLTREVAELLFAYGRVDTNFVLERILPIYEEENSEISKEALKKRIGEVLSGLSDQGICKPVLFFSSEKHSDAVITSSGRLIVDEIINPVISALTTDPDKLKLWENIKWRKHAARAVEIHKESSTSANSLTIDERKLQFLELIRSHKSGIRARDIEDQLGKHYKVINTLLAEGLIYSVKEGKSVTYFVKDEEEDSL